MKISLVKKQRGMALVVVLSFLAIMGILTGVVGNQASLALAANQNSNQSDASYYVAYGGLQRGLTELRNDPDWTGLTNKPFPGGDGQTYTIQVLDNPDPARPLATAYGVEIPPSSKLVVCQGKSSDSVRYVAGVVNTAGVQSTGFGALAGSRLESFGGVVEAFTTAGGFAPWELQALPGEAQVGTVNGITALNEKATDGTPTVIDGTIASDQVDGDLATSETGVYEVDASTSLAGETQLTDPAAMDDPATVTYLGGPKIDKPGGGTQTLFPGHYDYLHIGDGATITLEAGDYYFKSNFEMFDNSKIVTNGKVNIYVDQFFATRDHAAVNYKGDPRDCQIILTGNQPKYYWLPHSKNLTHPKPWQPGGTFRHGGVADESSVWGRLRAQEAAVVVSGTLYGDVQADIIQILGDASRASGKVMYFKDLDTGTTSGGPGTGAGYVYDSIFNVNAPAGTS